MMYISSHMQVSIKSFPVILIMIGASISINAQEASSGISCHIDIKKASLANQTIYLAPSSATPDYKYNANFLDSAIANEDGAVTFGFTLEDPTFLSILDQGKSPIFNYLLFNNGDNLAYKEYGTDSLRIKGPVGSQIKYEKAFRDMFYDFKSKREEKKNLALPIDSYRNYLTSRKRHFDLFLEAKADDYNLKQPYIEHCKAKHELWYCYRISRYLRLHNYYSTGKFRYVISDSINFDFTPYLQLSEYRFNKYYKQVVEAYVKDQFEMEISEKPGNSGPNNTLLQKFEIIRNKLNGIQHDIAITQLIAGFYGFIGENHFFSKADSIRKYFKQNHTSRPYYKYYANKLRQLNIIAPGKPAPNFTFTDTSGHEVSLSDFIGKVVYLNFWGTWCGPCIQAIPDHKALYEKFSDEEGVAFLNVALEYDTTMFVDWKYFIKHRDFFGDNTTHLFAPNGTNNVQLQHYLIKGLPTYVIIDKNGRISAPRAWGPKYVEHEIKKLLR